MFNTKEMREQRLNLENQINVLLEKSHKENRDLTPEEDGQYQKMVADSVSLKNRIERFEKQNATLKELESPQESGLQFQQNPENRHSMVNRQNLGGTPEDRAKNFAVAMKGWFAGQVGRAVSDEQFEAARACGMNVFARDLVIPLANKFQDVRRMFQNALTTTAGSGGAATLVGDTFVNAIELAMLWYGPMMQVADVMRTGNGADYVWPTGNDTGNSGRQIGETKAVAEVEPTLAANVWRAYKFTSDEILLAYETMEDSVIDLEQVISAMLGERLARILNTKFTTGTGAGTCYGVAVQATTGKTTASATAITLSEVLDLQYSVDPAYRARGAFMANDAVILALRKLVDSTGQFLWQPSVQAGQPDRLSNAPVYTNNDMSSAITTGKTTLLFGDFSQYKIRQVNEIRVYRMDERYRENDQTAFTAFLRGDGRILDAGTHPIKKMVQA